MNAMCDVAKALKAASLDAHRALAPLGEGPAARQIEVT
jgi:hypothetical protein